MPRRKQDCPKRMKWEGGEEGAPGENDKIGDEDSGSLSPNSSASPTPAGDEAATPPSGALLSPHSSHSNGDDNVATNQHNDKDMHSPRCQSRESVESTMLPRCLSGDSIYSDRGDLLRRLPLPPSALSPTGVTLPATLPAAAAAALLPPQSAAMAAYLNAAAAAAQHSHRLMMTSPLPPYNRVSASPLISSSSSPTGGMLHPPTASPNSEPPQPSDNSTALDFSKRSNVKSDAEESDDNIVNLSKGEQLPPGDSPFNSPLDLSVTNRKRSADDNEMQSATRKPRIDYKTPMLSQWPPSIPTPHLPYFAAAVAAANLSPKNSATDAWNGKMKFATSTPSDATKALEKMSELSKLGGDDLFRSMTNTNSTISPSNSRHSAWQSHWLNKGAEQAKDVLKCVWCKQSFPSLAAMTTHMKEAKHCGVNVPVPSMQSQNLPPQPPISSPSSNASSGVSSTSSSNKPIQSDLNLLIKETMPLPRKLVRGQDVWLGKGAEQTRQILKCMWCGQSFRSLAEMTSHMQQTQHYTNIISQEQIISWKSSDDSKGGGGGGNGNPNSGSAGSANSHVSAVLTCKVCDQAFSSLKELSNHMVKNSHYKEHIMRSITDGGRRRQTREKRKKSLPVRKLLELERAQHEFKNGDTAGLIGKAGSVGRITCEKCGDKIDTSLFVEHIRQCIGGGVVGNNQRNFLKSALMSNNIIPPEGPLDSGQTREHREHRKPSDSPSSLTQSSPNSTKRPPTPDNNNGSSPSVLNAIEKLIEKSFDSRTRQNAGFTHHGPAAAPMGSSILKRLGIDESVDYTKPLVDAQTMNLLRSYHQQGQHHFGKRERSGSESSSISERGSSRIDALTPERRNDAIHHPITSTPRSTPDKRDIKSPMSERSSYEGKLDAELRVKKETDDGESHLHHHESQREVSVKRELTDDGDDEERASSLNASANAHAKAFVSDGRGDEIMGDGKSPNVSPRHPASAHPAEAAATTSAGSPCRNSTSSPASSDRSTPRSSTNGEKKPSSNSLGALSSMFDSLSGTSTAGGENASNSGKRSSSHPLAALQKLCDKTETHHTSRNATSASGSASATVSGSHATTTAGASGSGSGGGGGGPTPGAILAFSWACNDAVMTSDSIMKCAFCDTPFISKGAYRHHLSKMHFVKDGVIPDPVALKSSQPSGSSGVAHGKGGGGGSAVASSSGSMSGTGNKSPPIPSTFEESPHSKFLKYTELAKQLSSKYV